MTQLIRALLIEDNRIEARQTQQWLAGTKDVVIEVEWVDRLAIGLERLSRGGLDVVLLDLNLPDSRGLETFAAVQQCAAGVPVVVLTGEQDEAMGLLAVQQGAEDYLVKQQIDGARLFRMIHYAVVRRKTQVEQLTKTLRGSTGRVVSFLGAKGGVGTTTVALNVAAALAGTGKSVILAELMPTFGGMAFCVQRVPTSSLNSLLELAPDRIGEQELNVALCPGPAAIRLLFGSRAGEACRDLDAEHTAAVIQGLARLAEFVILDLPAWPSEAVAAAVRLSRYVGVVVDREPVAVHCGRAAVTQLEAWGIGGGMVGAIVVGRSVLPLSMSSAAIQSQLGCRILRMVPPAAEACCRAHQEGVPLIQSQPSSDAAEAYIDIAKLVADDRRVRVPAVL